MPEPAPARRSRRRDLIAAIAIVDVVLLLFPPLHWWLADGGPALAIGYFAVSGLIVVASLHAIHRLDQREERRWTS